MFYTQLHFATTSQREYIDLTPHIKEWVSTVTIQEGNILVRTLHTTTAVIVNEHEQGLLYDLKKLLSQVVPETKAYRHDDFAKRTNIEPEERVNGFAHLQACLLGSQALIPVRQGKLVLGQWQSVVFLELDGPRQERTVDISFIP